MRGPIARSHRKEGGSPGRRRGVLRLLLAAGLSVLPLVVGLAPASAVPFAASGLTQASGRSPFASCTADAGQPGTNFANSEVEPWVDVNPTNPNNIAATWQQDRWSNGGARGLVAGVSFNGGKKWARVVIPKISVCSGGTAANGGDYLRASDPWLSFAPNGHLYHISLSVTPGVGGLFTPGTTSAMLVSKSTDGGLTWSDPITLIRDEAANVLNDKESITADPTNASFVYAVWDRLDLPQGAVINPDRGVFGGGLGFKGAAMFSRTTNGGASWEPARIIYNPGGVNQTIGNQIVVLPDGTLVNFFNEILNFRNDDSGGPFEFNLALIHSTDKGATWTSGRPIRAAKMQPRGVTDPDTGTVVRAGEVLPEVAVDPSTRKLYAVWMDSRFSSGAFDSIAFSMSTDGGFTWSTPIKVNQTPTGIPAGNQQAFTPSVHVAGDGTVGVSYYDFRNNKPAAGLETDYWLVHCHASCASAASWTSEAHVAGPFDIEEAPFAGGLFLGDYVGLAAAGNAFKTVFTQSSRADSASEFFASVGP